MKFKSIIAAGGLLTLAALNSQAQKSAVSLWLTNADRSAMFQQQKQTLIFQAKADANPTIVIDDKITYQPIDGFGFALTGGSAIHIMRMSAPARAALLKELFANNDQNIGVSYLRVSIGASDLNERVFSYDDLPAGSTDPKLEHFDLGPDKLDVIPLLKEILAINPKIKILGSPWSAPTWMKTNGDTRGGALKAEYYQTYANYLVKYIKGFKGQGISIDAITVQNEPLNPKNNPSMVMQAHEQADFIKNNLGPAFKSAGIKSRIIVYDHNCDRPDYADSILNDPAAAKYVDGSGFHLYGGKIEAMTDLHNAHPDKNLYFTEQMVIEKDNTPTTNVSSPVRKLFIGATRNWSRNVLEWNMAADVNNQPHTDRGGCPMCQGAITVDKDNFTRNIAYYAMAHASKFVRPGSVRVASNNIETLPNVAFITPKGKKVLIVTNSGADRQSFNIQYKGKTVATTLNKGAVGTYTWD
ncbi:glycoside hydrolase family 30 protein [Mucilaginibacter boryungensis]|uniref:Glucosylceramidase n=1 Tax=Mucilaginibacter boryungensis TaxID=768480 RepID=A0ABR9XDD1_9SPHI|nr:glycoside hydrolase family 30 beta sandwich domain-containing protein [Mucilaginibacter boryungensis]MBE9664984.1 glucosylceramidase [Mucilaginibacter boryungensis]